MRSVSLREFQSHHGFSRTGDQQRLQEKAEQLRNKDRSGMFQFSDLLDSDYGPSIAEPQPRPCQPEEEPLRRVSRTESQTSHPPGLDASQIPVIDPNADEELRETPEIEEETGPRSENPSESLGDSG